MENPTPDFLPLTPRQKKLLETIKALKEKQKTYEIQEEIDELSVKALRSGLMKNRPAETRHPGKFFLDVPTLGGRLHEEYKLSPGFADFHPDLPSWAKDHFIDWIMMLRSGIRRQDAPEILRKTKIVGIETDMKRAEDITLLKRVLELRRFEEKDGPGIEDTPREAGEKKKTRTRKEYQSWHWVIDKLVEEGLVKKVITPSGCEKNPSVQAFKKKLKNHYPFWPWEET